MVRIVDVARAAGVSTSTVSRVLNQPDVVVPEKRERVLAVVRELNYAPNSFAHGLRSGTAKNIALLVGDISQPFHGAFAKAVDKEGERNGFRVFLRDLDHNEERLIRILSELHADDTYGVILATADNLRSPSVRQAITAAQARGLVVVTSSQVIDETVPAIVPRYQAISHLATLHLTTIGAAPIIFIGGGRSSPLSMEREEGFLRACEELGHTNAEQRVLDGKFAVDESREVLAAYLDEHLGMDINPQQRRFGVVTLNVRSTIGALQAASDRDLKVPEQMAIVCCEELPLAAEWRPSLTTVGIDFELLAQAAFDSLKAGNDAESVTFLPHRLTSRSST